MLSYEVVVLTVERPDRIAVFAAYYLSNGARRVRIYHDGPAPRRDFGAGVELIECDGDFWEGARPSGVEDRQREVYAHAYRRCAAEWLLVVDIDEFVVGFERIAGALARSAPEALRIPSAEAVFAAGADADVEFGATLLRLPQSRVVAQILPRLTYPGLGRVFIRGLLGHAIGKQFVRAGLRGVEIGIHSLFRDGLALIPQELADYRPGEGIFLCHFDAISRPQWREKWERRLRLPETREMGAKRLGQMELYARASREGEASVHRLFDRLYSLTPGQYRMLSGLGLAMRLEGIGNGPVELGQRGGKAPG